MMLDWIGVFSYAAVIAPSLHFLSFFSSSRESMSTATATATTTAAFLPVWLAGTPPGKLKQAIQLPRPLNFSNTNNILANNGQNRVTIASASSSTPTIEEDEDPIPESITSTRGCQGCGSEEKERGCNGEGRIQGGIATVPGFGWWPIKAYRPCPSYLATGGRYRRTGQSMDDIGFGGGGGGGGRKASSTGEDAQMSKRKFKKSAAPRS